jgi:predicted acyltransferase
VASPVTSSSSDRIESLDALRGLTVLVCLACELGAPALWRLPDSYLAVMAADELSPSLWNGVTLKDLVLPMYLFVAGTSIVPAFQKRRKAGASSRQLVARILRRLILLIAIGLVCEGCLFGHWPQVRLVGALQRIAVCYAVVAWLYLTTGWRFQAALLAFFLVDYWALLAFGGSSTNSTGVYSAESNATAYVDSLLLPGRKYLGTWDPDGILTTVPAIAVTLAGLLIASALNKTNGFWRRIGEPRASGSSVSPESSPNMGHSPLVVGLTLMCTGIAAIGTSYFVAFGCPINGYLWTPTFCLIAVGAGLVPLGIFHATLDGRGGNRWARPLTALGANALVGSVIVSLTAQALPIGFMVGGAFITLYIVGALAIWLSRQGTYITV